jgi:RimJ/RimL family protein N-acetyltransferase
MNIDGCGTGVVTEGVLLQRGTIVLGWPLESEFDTITELRNANSVRRWFVDDRPLDAERNRRWLASEMDRPREALLSIRRADDGLFLGMLGWTDWHRERRTAVFGRLAIDCRRTAPLLTNHVSSIRGIALQATLALRDYAFEVMGLVRLSTAYMADNILAARVNRAVGLIEKRRYHARRPDGRIVEMVELALVRRRWQRLRRTEVPDSQ